MLPLRHGTRWRIAGIVLLFAVLAGALLPVWLFPDVPARRLLDFDKWAHGFVFLFLAVWFSGQYSRRAYGPLAVGLFAFGSVIELCQYFTVHRSAEIEDLYADGLGILAGVAIALAGAGGWSLRVEDWLAARQRAG